MEFISYYAFPKPKPPRFLFSVWGDLDAEVKQRRFDAYANQVERALDIIALEAQMDKLTEMMERVTRIECRLDNLDAT